MALNFWQNWYGLEEAFWLAKLVQALDLSDPQTLYLAPATVAVLGPGVTFVVDLATIDKPKVAVSRGLPYLLVLFQGVKKPQTVLKLATNYTVPSYQGADSEFNYTSFAAAQLVLDSLGSLLTPSTTNFMLAGHSFGATVSTAFGTLLRRASSQRSVRSVTFGSPRSVSSQATGYNPIFPTLRYYNNADPVLRVPAHQPESPVGHFFLSKAIAERYNSWRQVGVPIRLLDPLVQENIEPSIPDPPISTVDLFGWMTGVLNNQVVAHSIGEYVRLLGSIAKNAAANAAQAAAAAAAVVVEPPQVPVPPAQVAEMVAEMEQQQAGFAGVLNGMAFPRYFRSKKQGRTWTVTFNDVLLRTASSKRKARRYARRGNRLIGDILAAGNNDFSTAVDAVVAMV